VYKDEGHDHGAIAEAVDAAELPDALVDRQTTGEGSAAINPIIK